jgi:amino-acid N-acetyltransferase
MMLQLKPITVLAEPDPQASLNLRAASLDDVIAIYDLIKYWADKGRMLERNHQLLEQTIDEFLVLENISADGTVQVVGCVGLHRLANDLAEVRGLAIHPSFQHKGFGRWLVLAAERLGRDLGLQRLFAWTYEQRFFERCGFGRISRDEAALPQEIHAECQRCPFQTNCQEIAMLKWLQPLRPVVSDS